MILGGAVPDRSAPRPCPLPTLPLRRPEEVSASFALERFPEVCWSGWDESSFWGMRTYPVGANLLFINRSLKLTLDILLGAVVPILILSYLSDPLGPVPAYLLSALVPVGWVLVDLSFVSRRFNFITAFLGLSAIVRGLLAFWFVDGALYALKDTLGGILVVLVFGGSLLLSRPLLGAFVAQVLNPRTPGQESSLERLFAERPVARALFIGTAGLALLNAVTAAINFVLNLWMVSAPFGTALFNSQVARVNAVTRLTLGVPEFVVMGLAIWWVIYSLHSRLPDVEGQRDFWELVEAQGKRAPARPLEDPR